eukprot:CAMPEP_0182459402 /NCGR_PEP_ID=MMETSP1319-20130603/4543_1 /TAXON_ID=172717 /ORGANISM="Bolidomonas pacifica, Strain RCC208" /LENGTH=65 /DNA_ID=CAMNT_0024658317 /DNA_START=161 /DNA_END=354 /DNA_ORIENTATION=-
MASAKQQPPSNLDTTQLHTTTNPNPPSLASTSSSSRSNSSSTSSATGQTPRLHFDVTPRTLHSMS